MIKTFVNVTLGCKVNAYEIDAISQILLNDGFSYAGADEEVGVALINTCSVTSSADQKSRQQIRKLAKNYPNAILVVMGCYSQINKELSKDIPEINIVVGTSNRRFILDYIYEFEKTQQQIIAVDEKSREFTYEELKEVSVTNNARAFLKIQDGCDQFCTFCIIPLTRGKLRSRAPEDVIKEAKALVEKGYKEIVLTGIHTGAYGVDLHNYRFSSIVKAILDACPTLYSLRISSIEENEIDDDLLLTMKNDKRLASHLHIPLQSGSDEILQKMNRRYDTAAFLAKIDKIRSMVGDIAITTDVIVGFPGETEALFEKTYDFIKQVGFSELHVFPYSVRSRTPAANFKNHVEPAVKKQRVQSLISLSHDLHTAYAQKFVGTKLKVLIENYDEKKDVYFGHTSNYLTANLKSVNDIKHQVLEVVYNNEISEIV